MAPAKRASRIRGGRPARRAKGVARRPAARKVARRGTSARRVQQRNVRRQQTRKKAALVNKRPRPSVRPSGRPGKVLRPARPASQRKAPAPRPTRTPVNTSRKIKRAAPRSASDAFLTLNSASAAPDLSMDVSSLQSSLDDLQERAGMVEVQADIVNLDANLNHALNLLEATREKDYKYQNDLEDIAYQAMSRWQKIRDDVEASIQTQADAMQKILEPVNNSVQKLNGVLGNASSAVTVLSSVQHEVDRALSSVDDAERSIENAYSDIESQTRQLTARLTRIQWMLTQQEEASFAFGDDEDLYMAVKARWDQEGKDDPEGILFLTNEKIIFERKEKVATKKILFIVTEKEFVQESMISKELASVKETKAQSKGLFGHQDFLEVIFDDSAVIFHIDGQDSEDWVRYIKNARSGKIEEERATGTGLSFTDLTGELTAADILELQNEVNELQDELMLKDLNEELSELEGQVGSLASELGELRTRGYVVEKGLEADIQVLTSQWEKIKARSQMTLEYQTKVLGEQMSAILSDTAKVAGMTGSLAAARPLYIKVKSAIASGEAQAEAAEETVLDQYESYADEIAALDAHLEWVDWMLDGLETASFRLLAVESGVAAVEAAWERSGTDPENGILFLTDQRLIWEDRTGTFEARFDLPLTQVKDVKVEEDEESGEEDLVFSLGSDAPSPKARFSLSAPVGEDWVQMVGRARSDGYAKDRAVEIDESELERIRNAPSECANCGASLTAPVLRGQTKIECEFCGAVARI